MSIFDSVFPSEEWVATLAPSLRSLEPSRLVQALPVEPAHLKPDSISSGSGRSLHSLWYQGGLPFFLNQAPDFGYVTREPRDNSVSGLDSFGNLEVSPPVVANGKKYPLGRILFGGNLPG